MESELIHSSWISHDVNVLPNLKHLSEITIAFLCSYPHGAVRLNYVLGRTYEYNNITSPLAGTLSVYLICLKNISNCCCWLVCIHLLALCTDVCRVPLLQNPFTLSTDLCALETITPGKPVNIIIFTRNQYASQS